MALDEAVQEYVSYLDFIQVSRSWPGELVSHVDVANQAAAVFQDITFLIDQIELPEA
jgi:hypothetical protein|tara:strand:- start:56 stop:226 length:171 start_codon:yes stop_codon:yes gene_type:complete